MAYQVICREPREAAWARAKILEFLRQSRFKCDEVTPVTRGRRRCESAVGRTRYRQVWKFQLKTIRLKRAKDYCGNHAYACAVANPGRAGFSHKKGCWLEGADWVAFNNLVNDALDELGIEADVASSEVVVRQGGSRCIRYTAEKAGGEWHRYGEYLDCRDHVAPPTEFPPGTPGLAEWREQHVGVRCAVEHEKIGTGDV